MSRKVLIVDDDKIMLHALQKKLAKYSETFTMLSGRDGLEALEILESKFVSLVVLDLKMPRMDGISFLAHVKDHFPDIPVIIISGYRTSDLFSLAKKKGVIAYISKPFQVDDLAKVILDTLQKEAAGGTMNNVSPVVFLQLMEMEGRSCTIRAVDKKEQKGGVLYFQDGKLIDARMDSIYGIDAAYIMFGWDDVTLYIQNECPPRKNVINSDLQPIIMKAVEMKDEMDEQVNQNEDLEETFVEKVDNVVPKDEFPLVEDTPVTDFVTEERKTHNAAIPPVEKAMKVPFVVKVRKLLLEEVGENCGLEDIYEDNTLQNNMRILAQLESVFDFGKFKVASIKSGKETDRILLPGKSTTVIRLSAKGPQDQIIRVLSEKL